MLSYKYQNYLASYRKIIGNAFEGHQKALAKLALALDYYNQDKSHKALPILTKLLKLCVQQQDFAVIHAFLGICHEECNYVDLAIDAYEKSISYNPNISTVWSNLGLVYKNCGNYERAIQCFDKAIQVDERNAYPHYNLGALHYRMAQNEQALACCYKALQIQPNLYQSAEVICCIHLIEGRKDMYRRYYQIAVSNGSTKERMDTILQEYKKIFDDID